jgi:CBS domain-containing protein
VYIVEDGDRIVGVLTRTDLLRVVEVLSTRPISERYGVPVRHFMTADPVVVALDDSASVAALLMEPRVEEPARCDPAHGGRSVQPDQGYPCRSIARRFVRSA